ncbi:MAG: sulfatase, partial [Gammaproteobacteria bacterium]|nr:sulfatase [Gammaproteobacteria bacterium]
GPAPKASGPPNIVIILADDLGYGDIGAYGAQRIRTPHIDDLAARGLRFTQAYASANVCSPSRAGLMTGRYAIRSGLAYKVVTARATHGLPESEDTIAEVARRGGYRTMLIGKWHLGALPAHSPLKHGFDNFYGVPHSNDMPDFALYEGDAVIEQPVEQATLTRRYTDAALRFINDDDKRPFLLLVSHTFPHIPLHASKRFRGESDAGLYGDTVEELDFSTGRIVTALREAGMLDNTLILFTSDNGPFFEGSSGGLRGGKGNAWEGGYRVPLISAWPAVIAAGQVSDAITMNIDFLPTVAELAGVQPAAARLDGASLVPLFASPDAAVHEHLLYFNNESVIGVRSQAWKYVTHAYYTGSLGAFEKFDQLPQFDGAYEMLLDARGGDGEAYSYADRHPDAVKRLQQVLWDARKVFDPLRTRPADKTYPE